MHEQHRDVRRRHARDAAGLADGRRPPAHELLAGLARQPGQRLLPQRRRQHQVLERRGARGGALLALDVATVAHAHLQALGPRRRERRFHAERGERGAGAVRTGEQVQRAQRARSGEGTALPRRERRPGARARAVVVRRCAPGGILARRFALLRRRRRHAHDDACEPPLLRFDRRDLRAHALDLPARDEPETEADLGEPLVGVVGAQQQPMLRGGGEHAVGLAVLPRDEVVHQHADVGLVAPQHQRLPSQQLLRGIDTGDQTLRRGLLVTRRAADLAGEEEPRHALHLERAVELVRQHEVVLDGVARAQHLGALEPAHRADEPKLHVLGQARRHAVHVDLGHVAALGLEEHLVGIAFGELHHLVLDGWAVARPAALDAPRVERRVVQIRADDAVRLRVRVREPARHLLDLENLAPMRERHRRLVAALPLERVPVDRVAVEPGRRAGLEPSALEAQLGEALA